MVVTGIKTNAIILVLLYIKYFSLQEWSNVDLSNCCIIHLVMIILVTTAHELV